MSSSSYHNLPSEPPAYDFSDNIETPGQAEHHFQRHNDPFYIRAHRYTKNKIISPIQRQVIDPLTEIYADLERLCELYMAKLGNPLIVKRFLYVLFISIIMMIIMKTGIVPNDAISGGGIVTNFSDLEKLQTFINNADEVITDLKSIEENLEYFSSINHEAGTIGDLTLAKYIYEIFKQTGSIKRTQLMEVKTLLDYPETVSLHYDEINLDLSKQFNPFSKNCDLIEAGVIYVNYGSLKDFENLQSSDIKFEEKIFIMKLGKIPVFQKIQIAESMKCKAIIFINEYEDHPDSFTPVSAAMSNYYPGDPLTPGYSSMLSESRINLDQSHLSQIPSVSLSRNQISPILSKLETSSRSIIFKDGISSGDGTYQIKLINKLQYNKDHSIWNVIGKIEGREQSDEALIIAAKRDSLIGGTTSSNSGTVVLLQIVEMFHKLSIAYNWKPLRSIYFISFDATEYNFAGSTELLEGKISEIQKEIIAFIDVSDGISSDTEDILVKSTGLLDSLINKLSNEHPFKWANFQEYTNSIPFMQYGVPIVQLGYQNNKYPWATNEDTFEVFKSLSNNQEQLFSKFLKLSQMVTKLAISIVDEPLIPFDISQFVSKLDHHYHNLQKYQELKTNVKLDYNPIITPLLRLAKIGKDFQSWKEGWAELVRSDSGIEPSLLAVHRWGWNSRLNVLEKLFIDTSGISENRRTFKNMIYGPQFHKPEPIDDDEDIDWFTWPSVRDVIDEGGDIQAEIERVGKVIDHGINYFLQR